MGKGQLVVCVYISMSSGRPQPMTVMKVGVGSVRSDSGVTEEERVRRYSWQFWTYVSGTTLEKRRPEETVGTYAAEEMPNENDQLSRRDTLALIQLLERPRLALRVQYEHVADPLKVLLRG